LQQRALTNLPLHINGKSVESKATHWIDVHDPATQEVVCQVQRARRLPSLMLYT
jgi:hypothetical protein